MHRLDVQTSGVLLCAKSYTGAYWIEMQWCSHEVTKEYVALVHGWVDPSVTKIRKRIHVEKKKVANTERGFFLYAKVSESGQPAYTELTTLAHLSRTASSTSKSTPMCKIKVIK